MDSYPAQAERQPYGLYNMTGNVWEWCATDFESGSQDIEQMVKYRVVRGGSWSLDYPENLRVVYRNGVDPFVGFDFNGFRPARS